MSELLEIAINFASAAHSGQKRKYSGIPYITHPIAVMEIVSTVEHDENMLIAAVLHDVVEDTKRTLNDIKYYFGDDVAELVGHLTDVSKPEDGKRSIRKEIDAVHLSKACGRAKTIKLADLVHNSQSIIENDERFAKVYIAEKERLLDSLVGGDRYLYEQCEAIISNYKAGLLYE